MAKKKKKEWKFGKGWKGSTKAALDHHPEKFSKEACKHKGKGEKLCPYAIMAANKEKGAESHYEDQPSTLEGKPKKKKKYKEADKKEKKCFKEWLANRNPDFY
jgi:hypothetical protein